MATTLITGGTVVSATGRSQADVLIDGETIAAVLAAGSQLLGTDVAASVDTVHRCDGQVCDPRRDRRPHPHGAAVRRHGRDRHLRDRHPGGRLGRNDQHHRLRGAAIRRARAGRPRRVAREGRGQLRDRLRLPPDHRRRRSGRAGGDARADRRGRDELQALHGLPRRLLLRRRPGAAGDAGLTRDRPAHDDARRERPGHRRARRAARRRGQDRSVLPRDRTRVADGGGGDPSRDHDREPDRRPALRRARERQAGGRAARGRTR